MRGRKIKVGHAVTGPNGTAIPGLPPTSFVSMTTGAITPSPALLLAQQQATAVVNSKPAEVKAAATLPEVEGSSLSKEENLTITGNQRHLLMQKLSRERVPEVFSLFLIFVILNSPFLSCFLFYYYYYFYLKNPF